MQGDIFSSMGNGAQIDGKILQTFQKSFVQVQDILDQNKLLINEINQNHESRIPDNLSRNVGLIRELNNNIRRVVDLYADLSSSFTRSMEASSEGESRSDGKSHHKSMRSGAHDRNCSCWENANGFAQKKPLLSSCNLIIAGGMQKQLY